MAKAGVIAAFTLALGVVTFWAPSVLLQAFVPATGRTGQAPQARFLGASDASAQGLPSAAFGVATFAMSMVTALAAGRILAARGQRRAAPAAARRAQPLMGTEKIDPKFIFSTEEEAEAIREGMKEAKAQIPFAYGLIGGESAFSSGDYNFDPIGLSTKFPENLPWFREAELKHGRIAMLAWIGLVVPDIVRVPGPERCASAANVIDAHAKCVMSATDPVGPLGQVFIFCALVECCTIVPKAKQGLTIANAGDYQLGLNFLPKDDAKAKEMKLKELKNGRLAMVAFGGAITQAVLSGNGFPWLY